VGDKTRVERSAVPNPFTVASHSNSAQHHEGPFSNSSSFEEYLHVLVPTKTHSKKSKTLVTEDPIQIHSTPPYLHLYPLTCLFKSGLASIMKMAPFSLADQEHVNTAQVLELVLEKHQETIHYLSIALE
jgi:hypothetical protein